VRYNTDGDEILNHTVRVTGDETQVSYLNVAAEEQRKQWKHSYSPNKSKTFRQSSAKRLLIADEGSSAGSSDPE
jgi:hypothetical protein